MKGSDSIKIALGLIADDHQATGPTNGTGVDTVGFDECVPILNVGTVASTGTLDVHVEESADNVTFADITGAVFDQILAANDNTIYQGRINLRGRLRYIRAVAVGDGANAAEASVSFALHGAKIRPITPTNTEVFDV